jgi:hypothetical protein
MFATATLILWCWATPTSTLSCTDNEKNIPAAYRAVAEKRIVGPLADYPRLSIDTSRDY